MRGTKGSAVRSCGREALGPGVRRTRLEEELEAPGVSYLRSGGTLSPSDALKGGGLGMTSGPKTAVFSPKKLTKSA